MHVLVTIALTHAATVVYLPIFNVNSCNCLQSTKNLCSLFIFYFFVCNGGGQLKNFENINFGLL
jgi:hypothetical protein